MRLCTRCHESKDESEFYPVPVGDKISRRCKECKKQYERDRRQEHPEIYRDYELREHFGITLDEYACLLENQKGVCAICHKPETRIRDGKVLPLCLDHSHTTGRNRGLLCFRCNSGLGYFEDDPERLVAASTYLKEFF